MEMWFVTAAVLAFGFLAYVGTKLLMSMLFDWKRKEEQKDEQ